MKRGQHQSNYDWYYGNRLNMAFYGSLNPQSNCENDCHFYTCW
ncbi:MAG: hypothetical protein V8R15_07340 [Bacilli bacterium]